MKCHTGVDAGSGFVHTVEATAANVHNITVAAKLLRKDDKVVYGDSAYLGVEKRDEIKQDSQRFTLDFRVNRRPGRLPRVSDNAIDWKRYIEKRKSAVRCKVEHPLPDREKYLPIPKGGLPRAAKKSESAAYTL